MAAHIEDELEDLEPSLKNLVEQETLKWVFVGGKGGVGKTTSSCCIAVQLSKVREKVLIISTDPAHNLSDAFSQKFGKDPMLVNGFDNLYCMEIEPQIDMEELEQETGGQAPGAVKGLLQDLTNSIPGVDEAMSFSELMKQVQSMDYSCIVFDTAPTGHTLRLLSFPTIMDKALSKILALKNKFTPLIQQFGPMFGMDPSANASDQLLGKFEQMREIIDKVNEQFKDPEKTTFVCICIPEFLSLYETERLVQELTKFEIDTHNIVVNQVLFPDKDAQELTTWFEGDEGKELPDQAKSLISKTLARKRMQDKYIRQIFDLYEDFHVTLMPLLDHEVRGVPQLQEFSENLLDPVKRAQST
mmetsp:Transcript_1411/g.1936  ORF Transcript_1411/g.1936 Transcript_1411/m.1936 type:complete len:358 (-) Transcript_1411:207-1280(-)|eukprot:CAMPEP_0113941958 /NCGR_PEP_ID=MMETSP1339-20121228/7772_1 /TAXON_ID=94617 /ORGANISM="Fibrocapsa japonica" /LENGTH=357 /DNA_ID=CAMNT_0000946251 /DNA_START=56 /DNA_END=1129 /DNA_ORIENTATION=- /assembly_acc=CAM_ASM_000762